MRAEHILWAFFVWAFAGLFLYVPALAIGWGPLGIAAGIGVCLAALLLVSGIVGMSRGVE